MAELSNEIPEGPKEKKITGFSQAINIIEEEDGRFYVMKKPEEGKPGAGRQVFTYQEIDKEVYKKRIKDLAERIAKQPGVRLTDIIENRLSQYNLSDLEAVEKEFNQAVDKGQRVKTKPGYCVEVRVGKHCIFTLAD